MSAPRVRLYRSLLRLFPKEFRDRFGDAMAETFADRLRVARRAGRLAAAFAWWRGLRDVVTHGLAERRTRARERRGGLAMMSVLSDVAYALRLFKRRPGFACAVILTLALGTGMNVAIFSVVRAVLINDLPYPDSDELVHVSLRTPTGAGRVPRVPVFEFLQNTSPLLARMAVAVNGSATVSGEGGAEILNVAKVSPLMAQTLGLAPVAGRALGLDDYTDGSGVVLISDRLWYSRFGGRTGAVGSTLRINGVPKVIVGVMPGAFDLGTRGDERADVWEPLIWRNGKGSISSEIVARLPPGVDAGAAERDLSALVPLIPPNPSDTIIGVSLTPLVERHRTYARAGLLVLQAAAGLLLIITCANLGNLLLTHAMSRRREFGMRVALGAGRGRLVRQTLVESGVLASIGGALGVALAFWTVPSLVATASWVIPRPWDVGVGLPELAAGIGLATAAAFVAAVMPAFLSARTDVVDSLQRTAAQTGSRASRLTRSGLIAVEVLLAVTILATSGLLINSFVRVVNLPIGFEPRGLVVAEIPAPAAYRANTQGVEFFDRVRRELAGAGAHEVAFGYGVPYSGEMLGPATPIGADGRYATMPRSVPYRVATPEFFDILRIPIVRGRSFSVSDVTDGEPVIVVNEQFVREFGQSGLDVGTRLKFGPREALVVGIAGGTRSGDVTKPPAPAIYFPLSQRWPGSGTLVVRGVSPQALARTLREVLPRIDPDLAPFRLEALESRIAYSRAQRRFYLMLFGVFAGLGVALAAIGVYGVTAHVTSLRSRELGVRLALGSTHRQLNSLVIRQGLKPVALGLGAGLVAAWWAAEYLGTQSTFASQLYEITAHDPLTLAVAGAALLLVGALACWIPARRAKRIDPVEVLRSE